MAIPTLLSNLTAGANTAMQTVQEKKKKPLATLVQGADTAQKVVQSTNKGLAKKELSNLTNIATTPIKNAVNGKELLNKTVGIANQSKENVINQEHESTTKSLKEFLSTASENPNLSAEEITSKAFPEFKGKEQAVKDFAITIRDNPDATPEKIKLAFPELYPTYEPEPTLGEKIESRVGGITKSVVGIPGMVAESGYLDKPMEALAKGPVGEAIRSGVKKLVGEEELKKYQAKEGGKQFSQVAQENYAGDVNSKEFKQGERIGDIIQMGVGGATLAKGLVKNAPQIIKGTKDILSKGKTILSKGKDIVKSKGLSKKEGKILELVQPKLTPTVEAERAAQGLKKTNWYGKVKMGATSKEKEMVQLGKEILEPNKTVTYNVNKTLNALNKETDELINVVEKNPTIFNPKEITSRMRKIEKPLMIRGGENEAKYDAIINKFEEILKGEKKNTAGLLKARKKLDAWINAEIPNLYSSDAMSPLKVAVSKIRKIPNEWINEKIGGNIVKSSLKKQNLMLDMIDNMAGKTEKTGTSSIGRFIKKHQGKISTIGGGAVAGGLISKLVD